jgi:hypothetical protein
MKPNFIIWLAALILTNTGCSFDPMVKDVTLKPQGRTDFVAGKTYRLKQPVYLFTNDKKDPKEIPYLSELGTGGTPEDLGEFRRAAPNDSQVAGLLLAGERIRITRFEQRHVLSLGIFFEVYAVIASGELVGKAVMVNDLTKEGHVSGQAFVDPNYLEPVNE